MQEQKKNKVKHYFLLEYTYKLISVFACLLPLLILCIVKHKTYFKGYNGYSLTFAGLVLCIVIILNLKKMTKEWDISVWLIICGIILVFLKPIISDILIIVWLGALGRLIAIPFERLGSYYHDIRVAYRNGKINAETQSENFDKVVNAIEKGRV